MMAATTPGGFCGVAGRGLSPKEAASSARCSSNMWAATSGLSPAQSSAASANASAMPRDWRRLAILLARPAARVARVSVPERDGLAPSDGVGRAGRVVRTVAVEAVPVWPLPWPLPWPLSSVLLVSTDIGVDSAACFRIRAGLRQVGHRVASRIVRAQRSKQAA